MLAPPPYPLRRAARTGALALLALPLARPTAAQPASGAVIVTVTGAESSEGVIGCGLFSEAEAFPMDAAGALLLQEHPADPEGVTCRFEDVPPGTYAVSASHDRNGNGRTDTNLLGIPKEAWGVSNDVRPRMRAPRFEEAAFEVAAGRTLTLDVEVAR